MTEEIQTPKQVVAGAEEDLRYSSRKWILTKWALYMYTGVHLLNALMILVARHNKLIPEGAVEPLWSGSLTTWSMGVGAIILIYMGGNVASTLANKGK